MEIFFDREIAATFFSPNRCAKGKHSAVKARLRCGIFLAGILCIFCGCRTGFTPLPPKETRTYQSLLEWSHQNGMPGAILLVQTPQTNFLGAVGRADMKHKVPMRPDHEFRIGSVTKMFTGLTIMQLEKEGLLKSGSAITNYLPKAITDHIANSDRITVRQLLQHRSGIYDFLDNPRWIIRYVLFDHRGNWPPLRYLKYAYDKPARFPPGKRYEYSNSNFLLLGLIIDQVTGHPHPVEIHKRFLDPLQLTNTYYELSEPARGDRAHGYERIAGFSLDIYDWTPVTGGCMGMVSTVSDLAVFLRAVVHRSNERNFAFPNRGDDWGMVWQRADHNTTPLFVESALSKLDGTSVFCGHDGVVPGYFCMAWRDPKNDATIVWFGSSTLGSDSDASGRFEQILEPALFDLALKQANNKLKQEP